MRKHKKEKGFVLVFVIAVVSALSIMTGAMFFYYDSDLKSVSRNSVMQQVSLAAETGLQEGQKWITDQLNSNSFALVDIQNNLHVDDSDNKCLNRHGFTNSNEDVYYAKRIVANLGSDDPKFENMSYEVYVQRHADYVRSLYFSGDGPSNGQKQNTNYEIRSFAMVEPFYDFPDRRFTIEWWMKDKNAFSNRDTQIWEWGRRRDLVFKIKNDEWNPRMNQTNLVNDGQTVGVPIKNEWVHLAMVWDGGTVGSNDTGNVRIYQNGALQGTYSIDVVSRKTSKWRNPPEQLLGRDTTFIFGEGFDGYAGKGMKGKRKMSSIPFVGHVAEMRLWNISRTQQDIADNMNKRITGSEPGLVSYYKFNEGSGNTAKDFSTTRSADRVNNARIYGIGNVGTLWKTELEKYPVTSTTDDPPTLTIPPGEDVVFYKILSCGNGPQGQIIPLELVVSAPVQKGDVGDGKITLSNEDLDALTGQEPSPLKISLGNYVGQEGVDGDIKVQEKDNSNTNFFAFKRSMEQCNNSTTFSAFSESSSYNEGDCAEHDGKLWYLENDDGKTANTDFEEDDWAEVLGSGCDGVQFRSSSGDNSYGHYYKYFSTAPNVTTGGDLGYNGDSIDWWEAKRRAEQSTCGGMRGYLVSVESAAENEFIKDAVMCDSSSDSGCTGVTPFHVAAGETRAVYYGSRLDGSGDQHYVWMSNSDWRDPTASATNMQSESGPNMGTSVAYTNWQSGEPNNAVEPYADMEINRNYRVDGRWNDLRRIPNCNTGGLDCITGYVVEYGGFDSFRMQHDDNNDGDFNDGNDVDLEDAKVCVARATIEKDKYVSGEDYLKYDDTAEDAPSDIGGDTSSSASDSNTSDDWDGWHESNGVLTLVHDDKPSNWNPATTYANGAFVWFNNRVWKSRRAITGGSSLSNGEVPSVLNPDVWDLYDGTESDAPCDDVDVWMQAFESIKYFNDLEVEPTEGENPFANEDITDGDVNDDGETESGTDIEVASLGERVILFSLGPLHVNKHLDGYNHFYEFYEFPVRASGTQDLYNDRNRRFGDGFQLSSRLRYFGKTGYLTTITSESENDIVVEKAKGSGWIGAHISTAAMNTDGDLDTCGGLRQRSSKATAIDDWRAFKNLDTMPIYTAGASYTSGQRIVNPIPITLGTSGSDTKNFSSKNTSEINISSISKANPAQVDTSSNHLLVDDDIVRIRDVSTNALGVFDSSETLWGLRTGIYRVRVVDANSFTLHHYITREGINTSSISGTYTTNHAQMRELEGVRNEYYRVTANISSANANINSQGNLSLYFKDPALVWSNSGNDNAGEDLLENTECPIYRWITGPEQFIFNNRGLALTQTRTANSSPSANQADSDGDWTRGGTVGPSGQQVGEMFDDGMPFRYFDGTGEPNNAAKTEPALHMMGSHFGNRAGKWNDLHNWAENHTHNYSIRGLVIEYGGMENDGDPITRIATKRVIKLQDRRVTKAIVKIKSGFQTGDKLVADTEALTNLGLTATGNETATVTLSGDATCKNYVDLIQSMYFEHTASSEGTREISVEIGDVQKPTGASHYYQYKDTQLSYDQANFQASYADLCGIQGYLANVTTSADLTALNVVGVSDGKQAWVNGTDVCQGGYYRSGFWRYTSGPWKDKEFWRVRINTNTSVAVLESEAGCNQTNLRPSERSVRVGPFESGNWLSSHPAANNNDYLAFQKTSSASTSRIMTRTGGASSDVEGFIIRFGGSVGDFTGADIEEDGNDIDVLLGPIRAEISFYNDGSDNSIFISDEDTVKVNTSGDGSLSSGWSKTVDFVASSNTPMRITSPAGEVVTIEQWRDELAKVYYENIDTSDFTPGNRKIKIKLVYGDTSLNQEIGIVKAIGSRNSVTVTPISWNNR